ncbi:MAG: hypothetical protein HXY18_00970 [Bryobacteraceae bacterium]|nr:hypothetical protein [Bryobacteraceae bacterium]
MSGSGFRCARLLEQMIEKKKLHTGEDLIAGSMASNTHGVCMYPEWNVECMKQEKTIEKPKPPRTGRRTSQNSELVERPQSIIDEVFGWTGWSPAKTKEMEALHERVR